MALERGKHLRRLTPEQQIARLQKRILAGIAVDENGCWKWKRSRFKVGYGQIRVENRMMSVHRASFIAFNGPTGDLHVCHRCDVKDCVNPQHLFLGTRKDNMDDAIRKGRSRRDQRNGRFLKLESNHVA